jgi:hypothetical protein
VTTTALRTTSAIALLVAAAGIGVQIAGGADYPAVPPGAILLVVAAGIVRFGRWRWAPAAAVAAGVFLVVGLFAAGQVSRLVEVDTALDTLGLWIQMVAVVVALTAGAVSLRRAPQLRGQLRRSVYPCHCL